MIGTVTPPLSLQVPYQALLAAILNLFLFPAPVLLAGFEAFYYLFCHHLLTPAWARLALSGCLFLGTSRRARASGTAGHSWDPGEQSCLPLCPTLVTG